MRKDIELIKKFENLFLKNKNSIYSDKIYKAISKTDFSEGIIPIKLKKYITKETENWTKDFIKEFNKLIKEVDSESIKYITEEIKKYVNAESFTYKNKEYKFLTDTLVFKNMDEKAFKKVFNPSKLASNWLMENYKINGLTLSERIWKNSRAQSKIIINSITNNLQSGMSAKTMAKRLLNITEQQEIQIPKWLQKEINKMDPNEVAKKVDRYINTKMRKNAERVTRTEIQRAWRGNYVEGVKELDFVKGIKWNLSGSHPKKDICDDLATADLYGLGYGVYLPDKVPYNGHPVHPHCLCYLTSVLEDI